MIHQTIHSKQYRFFRKNLSVQSPCNPRRTLQVLLGLHGDCTKGFFLKNLYCLECTIYQECDWSIKNHMLLYVLVQLALCTITLYLVAIPFNDRRHRTGKTINIRPYDRFMMRIGWTQLDVILITSLMGVKLKDTYCPFGYKRVYLPGNKVADTPFHIEGDNVVYLNNDVVND